jgi:hypothetical protein
MSAAPVQLYGPSGKGTARQHLRWSGAVNNALFQTATQTQDRKSVSALDYDVHRTVTNMGRRTMMTLGRKTYVDHRSIGRAIEEMADLASAVFLPQYYGENTAWGERAEMWLENHDRVCDVAGPPYNMRLYRRLLLTSLVYDGDMLTVLVKTPDGFPMLQCVPGHRIGNAYDLNYVQGGEYDGARIIDGVIVDGVNRALAYRVNTGENPYDYTQFVDIPARDAFLSFIPLFRGQVRGFSELGMVAFEAQDVRETDRNQRLQSKLAAGIGLLERNELGEAPPPGDTGTPIVTAGTSTALSTEQFSDGIEVRYFRSSDPNAGIEMLKNDNPSLNQREYRGDVLRDIFAGIGNSKDFALDSTKIGGAPLRVLIERINRSIQSARDLVLTPACMRFDGFRVSCAIQTGSLPEDKDWWKWTYQTGAELTADKKYDAEVDAMEEARGYIPRARVTAKRGAYIEDVDKAIERDADNKWTRAKALATKFNIPIEAAYNSMWNEQPNGIPVPAPVKEKETASE